jgi:hypothetical protein
MILKPLTLLSCAAVLLWAGDFWKDKPASEWSDKDVTKMLSSSPWSKNASVAFRGGAAGGMRQGGGGMGGRGGRGGMGGGMGGMGGGIGGAGGGMGGGMGGGGMGGRGGGGGGMGGPGGEGMPPGDFPGGGGRPAAPAMVVRWESAAPVREAAARREQKNLQDILEKSKDSYVIAVVGSPMRGGRREGGPRPEVDPSRMEEMQQRLRDLTTLTPKDKSPRGPSAVQQIEGTGGVTMLFLFPRAEGIALDDKEVAFETVMGPMSVKAKFTLKDMMYKGKLDL